MELLHVRRALIERAGMLTKNSDPFNRIQRHEVHEALPPKLAPVKCSPSLKPSVTGWHRISRTAAVESAQPLHGPFGPAFIAFCSIAIQAISYYTTSKPRFFTSPGGLASVRNSSIVGYSRCPQK